MLLDFHPRLQVIVNRFEDPGQGISVESGNAKCDDVMGFLVALSGAFQNILAFSLQDPNYDPIQADRGIAIFAKALGYSGEAVQQLCYGPIEL